MAKLNAIIASIDQSYAMQLKRESDWRDKLRAALAELLQLLSVEHSISSYELYTSGLVRSLIRLLRPESSTAKTGHLFAGDSLRRERIEVFGEVFNSTMSKSLVRKLVAVLESVEKLPVHFYDLAGYSLQVLTKKLRFKLERAKGQSALIDRTGRYMKSEPLATVGQLEKYLLKMVCKQWYDYDRCTFNFVKKLKEKPKLEFTYESDFDE